MQVCYSIIVLLVLLLSPSKELEYASGDTGKWKRAIQREVSQASIPTDDLSPFKEDFRFGRSLSNSSKNFTHFYEVSDEVNENEWPHIQVRQFIDSTKDPRRWALGTVTYIDSPRTTFSVLEPFKPGSCDSVWPVRSTVQTTAGRRPGGCAVAQNAGFFRMSSRSCLGNIVSDGRFVRESDHVVNANFGIKSSGKIFVGYLSNEEVKNQSDPFLQLVSGVIWLVKNGTNFVNESMHIESDNNEGTGNMSEFVNVLSARTALGHDNNGRVMMLVVEGQTHKRGVNLFELADILIEQGAVNAINLDGGGSATVVEDGILSNHVSDHCAGDPEYRCMRAVSTILCAHDVNCVPQDCNKRGQCVNGECNCTEPWTGIGCSQLQCSNATCRGHGACKEAATRCECEDGWMGELCEHTCPKYFYGPNCREMCWCSFHGSCHPSTGACLCDRGYEGEKCGDKCAEGRYGDGCQEECECNQNEVCDHLLGCVCENGWEGEHCNISLAQNITSQDATNDTTSASTEVTSVPKNVTESTTEISVTESPTPPASNATSHTVGGTHDTATKTTPIITPTTPPHSIGDTATNSTQTQTTNPEELNNKTTPIITPTTPSHSIGDTATNSTQTETTNPEELNNKTTPIITPTTPPHSIGDTATNSTQTETTNPEELNNKTTPIVTPTTPPHSIGDTTTNSTQTQTTNSTEEVNNELSGLLKYTGINISASCVQPLLLSYLPLVACSVCSNLLICFLSWLCWGGGLRRKNKKKKRRNMTTRRLKLQKVTSPVSYEPVSTQIGNESSESSS